MKIYISESRNIYNLDELQKYLADLSERFPKENVKMWIFSNLRNWFLNKCETIKKVTKARKGGSRMGFKSNTKFYFVFFRLKSRSFNKDPDHALGYLSTLKGKLNNSVEDALKAGEKYIEELNKKASDKEGQTETLYTFKDGYTFVSLLDGQACKREGKLMQHCSGDETQGYIDGVKYKEIELWSLRDSSNQPHCTIEFNIKGKKVLQIKGKQNAGVVKKYIPYVKEFLQLQEKKKIVKNYDPNDLLNIGILEQDGVWYDILCLPENFTVKGSLYLSDTQIENLPGGLTVKGDLYIRNTQIKELPEGLTVGGDLNLRYTPIEKLPNGLIVGRNLDLMNTPIECLPEGLTVGGYLEIRNTKIKIIKRSLLKNVKGEIYKDDATQII
jgi:hypothetical protein